MASLLLDPFFTVLDANGKPVNNAKVWVYDEGTTDAADIYSDKGTSTALAQPVRTNSAGKLVNGSNARVGIYVDGGQNYKVVITTSADAAIDELDAIIPYSSSDGGTLPIASGGTNAPTALAARNNLGAASAADLSALSTTVSDLDGQIDNIGGDLGDMAGKDSVENTDLAAGFDAVCIQRERTSTTAKTTYSGATVPQDTTTPQVTEGEEVFSVSFTPSRTDSTIKVTSQVHVQYGASLGAMLMLFTSESTNCIQTSHAYCLNSTPETISLEHEFASPGTSAVTISIRLGAASSTAPLVNLSNFSTVPSSWMEIKEIIDAPVI